MEKAISFLASRKITGAGFDFSCDYLLCRLKFSPTGKTTYSSVQKSALDFALHVGAAGPAMVRPLFDKGQIEISWVKEAIVSQPLPISPRSYSVPLGVLADGTHKSISLPLAPHIMVAGTTGSGKSYWMHGAIRWALGQGIHVFAIDPKWGEFGEYKSFERFYHIAKSEKFTETLSYLVERMNLNYENMATANYRSIKDWSDGPSPILCVIDELSDAILTHGDAFLKPLLLLAQKGRAAGIHIVAGTQAPTAKLLSGELKANFPVKIAFKTANATASRVVLDQAGAEKLSGAGDGICIAENGDLLRFKGYRLLENMKITKIGWRK